MPRKNDRLTEYAFRQRNEEAAAHQDRAAGITRGGFGGGGGGGGGTGAAGGRPLRVQIVGGEREFFDALRQAMGFTSDGGRTGASGGMGDMSGISSQFQAVLSDQQAISQMSKQITSDLQLAVNMVTGYQATVARQMGAYTNDLTNLRRQETQHVQSLVNMLSGAASALTNAARSGTLGNAPAGSGGGGGQRVPPAGAPGGAPIPGGGGSQIPQPGGAPTQSPHRPQQAHTTLGTLRNNIMNAAVKSAGGPDSVNGRALQIGMQRGPLAGLKATPIVGPMVEAGEIVNNGAQWVTAQRARSAPYQSIYGGQNFSAGGALSQLGSMITGNPSNDTSGFGQRMAEEGFVLAQRFTGGMTSGMSRQAFQGVSNLGYAGDQRSNALDFMSNSYKQLGTSIGQSLQVVQIAAQNSNQALGGLSDNLNAVSQAASATGQNAGALRQNFIGNYQSALQGGLGSGSGSVAQAITNTTVGTNRDFANLNMQGLLSNPVLMQQVAAQGGMSLGQLEAQTATGNTGAFTKNLSAIMNQRLTGTMDQNVRNTLSQAVKSAGGNASVAQSPGSQYDIAIKLMQNRDWNVQGARQTLSTMGVSTQGMSDEQVAEYYVSTVTSGGLGAQANAQNKANGLQNLSGNVRGAAANGTGGSSVIGGLKAQQGKNSPSIEDFVSQLWGGDGNVKNAKSLNNIIGAYQGYEGKYGKSNPAIDSAIKDLGTGAGTQIRVRTQSGDQVVSMADAIKYYSDQISNGSALVEGGPQNGKRLSEVTGVTVPGFVPGKNGQPNSSANKAIAGVGESWSQYQKDNPNQPGNAASQGAQKVGTVTVSPSAQLMQMFNWSSTGGVDISGSTAAGLPPALSGGTQ